LISNIEFFYAGYCTHPEWTVLRGGNFRNARFPAGFSLIQHSKFGNILFDTGYSEKFYAETTTFPFNIYAKITPVYLRPGESAKKVLQERGIDSGSIKYIIISHFHADHICGLRDFDNARFVYSQPGYALLKRKAGFGALKSAFLSGLIPADFEGRTLAITNEGKINISSQVAPFTEGYDLFGEGSIVLVDLPGHAAGQMGALLTDKDNARYFLIADAAWKSATYQKLRLPSRIADVILHDKKKYLETLGKINQLHINNPAIKIVLSHCAESWKDL